MKKLVQRAAEAVRHRAESGKSAEPVLERGKYAEARDFSL
jgi:hypothetical protein